MRLRTSTRAAFCHVVNMKTVKVAPLIHYKLHKIATIDGAYLFINVCTLKGIFKKKKKLINLNNWIQYSAITILRFISGSCIVHK